MRFLAKCIFSVIFLLGFNQGAFSSTLISSLEEDNTLIENCIDPITGSYFDTEIDYAVLGCDSLVLKRYYSSNISSEKIGSWYFFSKCFLVMDSKQAFTSDDNGAFFYENHPYGLLNANFELTAKDGTVRYYAKTSKPKNSVGNFFAENAFEELPGQYYHLEREKLPNGHFVYYSYDRFGRLAYINIKDNTDRLQISWASFEYLEDQICIKTSDDQKLRYKFKDGKLIKVERPNKPNVQYEYSDLFLKAKIVANKKELEIEYDNDRVSVLKKDGESQFIITYKDFETEVFNSKISSVYFFNEFNQVVEIQRLGPNGEVFCIDKFSYDQNKLISKTSQDGALLALKERIYDTQGNVIKEKMSFNNQECFLRSFEYRKNLLVREKDSKEEIVYVYKPLTNLLETKILYDCQGKILQSSYYEYNNQNILVKIISKELKNTKVIFIKPKMSLPFCGLAESVEETSCHNNEFLTKRVQSKFDKSGWVYQDVFDNDNPKYSMKFNLESSSDYQMGLSQMLQSVFGYTSIESNIYDLCLPELDNGMIGFSNGIRTSLEEASHHAKIISDLANGFNVHYLYNASYNFVIDLMKVYNDIRGKSSLHVQLLQQKWRKFFDANPGCSILEFCHSGGSFIVRNALLGMTKEERDKIVVVAIAPALIVSSDLCKEAYNYVSTHDVVPFFDFVGMYNYAKDVYFLTPDQDALLWDHDFESPTYRDVIKGHIDSYIKESDEAKIN
ncbi:MAG: hypothetical protein HZB76_07310 [Chlamydiae bacterium]|nr:hypothetical protein [Chlamydiota bacterium]